MKVRLNEYTFVPNEKKIILPQPIPLEAILLIVNVTRNEVLYNFMDKNRGGQLTGQVLTLTYDTTNMSPNDRLLIYIDDSSLDYPQPTYRISDIDERDNISYFGFLSNDGQWYIMRVEGNQYRYIRGDGNYEEYWANRASLEYRYYHEVF